MVLARGSLSTRKSRDKCEFAQHRFLCKYIYDTIYVHVWNYVCILIGSKYEHPQGRTYVSSHKTGSKPKGTYDLMFVYLWVTCESLVSIWVWIRRGSNCECVQEQKHLCDNKKNRNYMYCVLAVVISRGSNCVNPTEEVLSDCPSLYTRQCPWSTSFVNAAVEDKSAKRCNAKLRQCWKKVIRGQKRTTLTPTSHVLVLHFRGGWRSQWSGCDKVAVATLAQW